MAQQIPAFCGKFGSTDFFIVTMKAGELVRTLTVPKDMEGWDDLTPEERYQREVNYKRVATHIAPYLAEDEDRFIGSFIVAVHQDDEMEFESLVDAGIKFPKAMPNSLMKQFGVLYLSGSEVLVPLDGQHRLAALKFAIDGKDNKGKPIPLLKANPKVAEDVCSVIMIRHDAQKARKIFNKVNRYAKPTSKADNLITADDDYIAVICRENVIGELIDSKLVNIVSNTLPKSSPYFTTLATIYEISLAYEEALMGKKVETSKLPAQSDVNLGITNIRNFWEKFLEIAPYKSSLLDPEETGNQKRVEIRDQSVACRPIVQRALAETIILLTSGTIGDGNKCSVEEAVDRINNVDWDPGNPTWAGVLMNGDRVITGKGAMKFAARILSYMLGLDLETKELSKLKEQFSDYNGGKKLPNPLFD